MASGIILSAGVRQNLLSLQSTAALMATTQNRLATGKKVNSALDNPSNFFTSQSLSDRASDLNALLDQIGQAQQTLNAANNGITSLTSLVQSAKSVATQAVQTTKGTVNYTNITGTIGIAADTTQVSATGNLSTVGNVTVGATTNFSAAAVGQMQAGDTLTLTIGATNHTFTVGANNAAAGTFADAGGLVAAINHANGFGGLGAGIAVAALDGSGGVNFTALDLTAATSHALGGGHIGGGNVTDAATQYGDALTISTGATSQTFYRVASGYELAAAKTYKDAATLGTDIGTMGGPVTTSVNGNGLDIKRADGGALTFSGNMAVAAGYATSASGTTYAGNYNAAFAGSPGSTTPTLVSASADLSTAGTQTVPSEIDTYFNYATLVDGDNLTLKFGGTTRTFTYTAAAGVAALGTFHDKNEFVAAVNDPVGGFGGPTGLAKAIMPLGIATLLGNDLTNSFTVVGGSASLTGFGILVGPVGPLLGDPLTISTGSVTQTFYRVWGGFGTNHGSVANRTYTDAAELQAAIAASTLSTAGGPVTSVVNGTGVDIIRADGGPLTFSGDMAVAAGYANNPAGTTYNGTVIPPQPPTSGDLTIKVGANQTHTIAFGSGPGQVNTRGGLNAALAAFTDITGSVDSTGHVNLAPVSSDPLTVSGSASVLAALGLTAGTTTPTSTVVRPNDTRANLQTQYNDLLTQIDQLARDSSYNGVNLLGGDNLKVVFNEDGSSSLTISGVKFNAAGLGLAAVSGTGFQDNAIITATLTTINISLTTLRTQASRFGSNLTTVQTRQDFTKNMVNTLKTGSDNLVLADTNEEGANMLALQTRQQLSTTALSLANQANQAVLRLFG
jgi:flagellin-like hook-associated protein FlgL